MRRAIWPQWALGGAAFTMGSLLVIGLGFAFLLALWGSFSQPPAANYEERPVYSRADFTDMVLGKTESEVIRALGKPDLTSEDSEVTYWHYRKRTKDPLTGNRDSDVQLVFREGKVATLAF